MISKAANWFMVLVTFVIGIMLYIILNPPTPTSREAEILALKDSVVTYRLTADRHAAEAKIVAESLVIAERQRHQAVQAARQSEARLTAVLAEAESVLADTLASIGEVKLSLHRTILVVRQYQDTVTMERAANERSHALKDLRITALDSALTARTAESRFNAEQLAILEEEHACTVFGRQCPTRKQSFVGGMATMGIILIALIL